MIGVGRVAIQYRILAALIDCVILGLLAGASAYAVMRYLGLSPALIKLLSEKSEMRSLYMAWRGQAIMLYLVPAAVTILYTATETRYFATPGKMMLNIFICDSEGGVPTGRQLLLRWTIKNSFLLLWVGGIIAAKYSLIQATVLFLLSGIASFLVVIGMLVAVLPSRRAIYDMMSGTAVYTGCPDRLRGGSRVAAKKAVEELIFK